MDSSVTQGSLRDLFYTRTHIWLWRNDCMKCISGDVGMSAQWTFVRCYSRLVSPTNKWCLWRNRIVMADASLGVFLSFLFVCCFFYKNILEDFQPIAWDLGFKLDIRLRVTNAKDEHTGANRTVHHWGVWLSTRIVVVVVTNSYDLEHFQKQTMQKMFATKWTLKSFFSSSFTFFLIFFLLVCF